MCSGLARAAQFFTDCFVCIGYLALLIMCTCTWLGVRIPIVPEVVAQLADESEYTLTYSVTGVTRESPQLVRLQFALRPMTDLPPTQLM